MNVRSIIAGMALVVTLPLYAGTFYKLSDQPIQVNQCNINITNNALDLALNGPGYFVVTKGKNQEKLFTRRGALLLDVNGYIRTENNHLLLKINKNSDYNHLSKIKISNNDVLPPKATKKIAAQINLSATAAEGMSFTTHIAIYDALGEQHLISVIFTRTAVNSWDAQVLHNQIFLTTGKLRFNNEGHLVHQEGLTHIQWPARYGMHELNINYKGSTQYASEFSLMSAWQDGHVLGRLIGLNINRDGEINLFYTNGQTKMLKGRIAIAKFTNPQFLEPVMSNLYRPSDKSGNPMVHWVNGEYSIISGALEEESCLIKDMD